MAELLNLTEDFRLFDGVETILFHDAGGLGIDRNIAGALRMTIENPEDVPSGGVYVRGRVEWQLPKLPADANDAAIGVWPPSFGGSKTGIRIPVLEVKPADTITDSKGEVWTVLQAEPDECDFVDYWGCYCINLKLEHKLYDLITVKVASASNVYGAKIINWTVTHNDIPARVQPSTASEREIASKRGFQAEYTVYVGSDLGLRLSDIIVDQATTILYEVKGYDNKRSIDDLMSIYCVRLP